MSYAHEIFGVRETRHDMWMQDLMLAGTSSVTFNSDRMREIAASPFVKDNGWAGYYLLLWCKYNNVPLNEVFRLGQKVSIANNDYGTVDTYVLVSVVNNIAHFASSKFVALMPVLPNGFTYYDGAQENTLISMWLRSETPNWHNTIVPGATGLNALVAEYGYSHGVSNEFKDILKQNVISPTNFYPVVSDEPFFLYNVWYPLGVKNVLGPTSIHVAKIILNNSLDAKIKAGGTYWSSIIPSSNTESYAHPMYGPTWLDSPHLMSNLANVNEAKYTSLKNNQVYDATMGSFPRLDAPTAHLARFSVDF